MNQLKLFFLTAFLSLFFMFSLSAQWDQELIPLDDEIYELTEMIYGEAGLVIPNLAKPWSRNELNYMIERLPMGKLSPLSRRTLETVRSMNKPESSSDKENLSYRIKPNFALEYFDHWEYLSMGDVPDAYPADYTAEERHSFLEIPFQLSCFDTLYLESRFNFRESPVVDLQKSESNYLNLPTEAYDTDFMFPQRAYINAGGEQWDISLGRFSENWGNGRTGNMYLSDNSEYIDHLRAKGYWDKFSFTYIFASLEPRVDDLTGDYDKDNWSASKSMVGHRFEFTPFSHFRISFIEGLIMGGEDFQVTLYHLNPMMLYHNWFTGGYGNSYHSLEADVTVPHFRFYAQAGLDQYQSSAESAEFPDGANEPSAFGWQLGYESTHSGEKGYFRSGFEFVYTMPYLYTYSGYFTRPTNGQFISADTSYILETPLGYFEGPDSIVFSLYGLYEVPRDWSLKGEVRYSINGANTIKTSYPFGSDATDDLDYTTPTGVTEREWKFALDGEKRLNENLLVGAGLTLLLRDNPEDLLIDTTGDVTKADGTTTYKRYTGTLNSLEWNCYISYEY